MIENASTLATEELAAYYTYRPRPDQPERYDEQTSFYNSQSTGVIFHIGGNGAGTSENALAKVAKFVLRDQPPPRWDTPYWVIAGSYEQVMEACWKEKLWGHGHIPDSEIDWERVRWKDSKSGWPFRVPLKPWPGRPGRNWVLEFKSYEQGRQQFQARAPGGFCFVEQFPYVLLTEVLRGSREYNFPGSKLAEFTPVDPEMSFEVQRMIEEDSLPPGWEVWRANTRCNMEAGYISEDWYHEFFGMVPEEMRLVREIGEFAGYEGQIYTEFNPRVHIVDDDVIDFPANVYHFRAIDWGAGPANAFCCLWGYQNGLDQWFIYDELYLTDDNTTHEKLMEVCDQWPWPQNNPHYGVSYADPSSPDHIKLACEFGNAFGHLGYENLPMMKASNAVIPGIEWVKYLLKPDQTLDGKPRLFIHGKNCPNLARQMRTYRWAASSEMGINPRDARMEPVKKNDHAVDALRYLCYSRASIMGHTPDAWKKRPGRDRGVKLYRGAG